VTLGFNVPQSGPYADEGADELRAYELAVEHLNGGGDGGMLNTFSSKALQGNGILGKKVEYVTGDTQTKSDAARASAKSMIEKDGAIMITGGSSSGVAVAVQALCQEAGVIFMAGLTHSNDTTGKDKKANGFRHFFNSYMSGAALAPVLANAYGTDRKAYHLTADYNWGYTTEEAVRASTEALGWETVNAVKTPLTQTDFSSYIAPVLQLGADVLVLNHYGGNMVNSLTNAVQFGLREASGQRQELRDRRSALLAPDGEGCRREREGHLRLHQLALVAAGRGLQGLREVLRHQVRLPAEPGRAHLLRADAALCGCRGTRRLVQPLRGGRSAGRLRVRRSGQRPDALPRRRPPVLQGRARREGEREPDLRVRPSRNRRSHAGRAGHLRARPPAVGAGGDLGSCNPAPIPLLTEKPAGGFAARSRRPPRPPGQPAPQLLRKPRDRPMDAIILQILNGLDKGSPMR
jgi:hypothetical protein